MLSEKAQHILQVLLLNQGSFLTVKTLSSMLGMSERTVNTYLKEVAGFCEKEGVTYVSRRGTGIRLELTRKTEMLLTGFIGQKTLSYDDQERQNYICRVLLEGWENYTAALFAGELYVSRQTVGADLARAESWLSGYNIRITKSPRSGMSLTGTEAARRSALAALFRRERPSRSTVEAGYDYRLSGQTVLYLFQEDKRDLVRDICRGLQLFEAKTHQVFVDYSFVMMVEYLLVQRKRMEKGILISREELETIWEEDGPLHTLAESLEFAGRIRYPAGERMYMGLLLCGAEFQREEFWHSQNQEVIRQAAGLCHYIVSYLSGAAGLSFYGDRLLAEGLESFLCKSMIRTRYGFAVCNPFLDEVKTSYGVIFNTCFGMGSHIRSVIGRIPSEHEIGFLALMIGGALIRIEKKVNAVLVGAGSLLLAEVTARKIEKRVDGLRILAVLSRENLETAWSPSWDLVITSIPELSWGQFSVYVTPIVSDQDVMHLQKACSQIYTRRLGLTEPVSLGKYIRPGYILLDMEAEAKEKLIRTGCRVLEEAGCITPDYYQEILNREAISSTEIGNGVAIPHGIENHVLIPAVCMIRLKKKINWGNGPVDMIFLLALNFNDGETTRRFFKLFYEKVGNEQTVGLIRAAKTREEVLELLD
ncbi:MAG: PTS transporter subunit EIIA [Lachnospiraceae bacterium]|nr:PTS transporter subunit EIIA [Lachnospiraceae bacterium]